MPNNIRATVGVKDNASNELDRIKAKFAGLQKQGAKGIGIGIAAGATTAAVGILGDAVGRMGDLIGDATQAAMEEEVSIKKLGAALQANIKDWNGNTDAIEQTLQSRMRLGFADDEQRESLATLVAVTKDSTKALDLQRKAMDLARLRNISLQAAADILGKVYGGNIGILSRYGIQVKKGATATEALAEVTKMAAGQAEAYANTNSGKLLAAQVKVGEAMEKFGAVILPTVADAAGTAADAITTVTDAMTTLNTIMPETSKGTHDLGDGLGDLISTIPGIGAAFQVIGGAAKAMEKDIDGAADHSMDAVEEARGQIDWAAGEVEESFEGVGEEAGDMKRDIKTAAERSAEYFHTMYESIQDDVDTLQDEAFDPIEERLDQQATHFRIVSAIESRESAKGKDAVVDANRDIVEALDDQVDKLQTLGKRHKLTAKDVDQYEADVTAAYKAMGKKVPPEIQKVIAKLRTLAGFNGKSVKYTVRIDSTTGAKRTGGPKAAGGTVAQGVAYPVGENGPELFVPDRSGTIIPTGKAMGGATYNYNLTVLGDIRARDESSLLATMRRLQAVARPNVTSTYG